MFKFEDYRFVCPEKFKDYKYTKTNEIVGKPVTCQEYEIEILKSGDTRMRLGLIDDNGNKFMILTSAYRIISMLQNVIDDKGDIPNDVKFVIVNDGTEGKPTYTIKDV